MNKRFPFSPFPSGWYVVVPSADLAPGQLEARTFLGREVVVYRTAAGVACVADAYCPHMGAHFAKGGSVDGEKLRCPFHDFRFDTKGHCVSTPYGHAPPAAAKLRQWPVHDRNGFVLAWFDEAGRAPWFEVPDIPTDASWHPLKVSSWTFPGHPQETTENSVDIGHFAVVHKYTDVEVLKDLVTDGPYLNARYAMRRGNDLFGIEGPSFRAEFEIHVHGLGWSFVDVSIAELGMRSRHYVLPTPIDGDRIELRIAYAIQDLPEPGRVSPAFRLLPRKLATRLVGAAAWRGYQGDVAQDLDIWTNKAYLHPPALAKGDGPVGRYRAWARQFYVEPERTSGAGSVATAS